MRQGVMMVSRTRSSHERLLTGLYRDYEAKYPASKGAHRRSRSVLIDGASHGARLFKPYPFRIRAAQGAYVTDLDGNAILDFWQGHYANILGHNPAIVREALTAELEGGGGLQTGHLEERQTEYASILAKALDADRVRLTTAGTLATMYAVMLARAFTGRKLVVKMAGGWHGAHPLALKGVRRSGSGYDQVDSAGLPATTAEEIIVVRFNDPDGLRKVFRDSGDRIACLIFELCPGAAGFIPATDEFVKTARRLTEEHGALLILDEVITGFRLCASGAQRLYGVKADLTTLGKVIGGGMPLSAVLGRADIMDLASEEAKERVWFNGGTFSAHPLAILAGKTLIEHLMEHESQIYPSLAAKSARLRAGIEKVFADRGVLGRCGGHPSGPVEGSSLGSVYFPLRADHYASSAEDLTDPGLCDVVLQGPALKVGLLLNGVNVVHGLGAVSRSHTDEDMERVFEGCDAFALRVLAGR